MYVWKDILFTEATSASCMCPICVQINLNKYQQSKKKEDLVDFFDFFKSAPGSAHWTAVIRV